MKKFLLYLRLIVGFQLMLCGLLTMEFGAETVSQRLYAGILMIIAGVLVGGRAYGWFLGEE